MRRERGTQARIHTAHISHNLKQFRRLHPGKIIAVVKADAYGHGLERVVPHLSDCDAFAVATIEEALELRRLEPQKKIILLEGVFNRSEMRTATEQHFDVVVHQDYQIDLLLEAAAGKAPEVWLKIDTGMNRLGFHPDAFTSKLNAIEKTPIQKVRLMTHYASSESVKSTQTQAQSQLNQWIKSLGYEYSFSNTGAVLNHLAEPQEWARVGIGLYGMSPLAKQWAKAFDLQPVMHLTAKIIATKKIKAGSQVGYGGTYQASTDMRIGVVGIGYADGYPWSEHPSQVLVRDRMVRVLGRVSMDMMAIDLSVFDQHMTGETVTIWGDQLPIEQVAADLKMIPYALTCGITRRVKYEEIQ